MILIDEVLRLHENSIRDYGGSFGIRDKDLLESAIARPFQTFGGIDLYTSVFEKAAALLESLIKNHPFVDGNKRTGFLAAFVFLHRNNFEIIAEQENAYDFVIKVGSSQLTFEEIVDWLQQNSKPLE
ncbi:MAG: type II toxin-antitoxin system death-on-curing family toxin [Parafilimonas sp.]